jgi:transcriptional regulator with XRE-family HTH domain
MQKVKTKTNMLKARRVQYDYSQTDVAENLNMTMTTYGKKERGDLDFSQSEIYTLKNLLHMNNEEFFEIFFTEILPKC